MSIQSSTSSILPGPPVSRRGPTRYRASWGRPQRAMETAEAAENTQTCFPQLLGKREDAFPAVPTAPTAAREGGQFSTPATGSISHARFHIDPFGFKGLPMALVARIVRHPRCECLVSFMYEY